MGIESSSAGAAAGGSQAQALGAPKDVSLGKGKYKCPRLKWAKNIGLGALGVTNWQNFLPSGLKIQASILTRSEFSKSSLQKIWWMAKASGSMPIPKSSRIVWNRSKSSILGNSALAWPGNGVFGLKISGNDSHRNAGHF